MNQYRCETCKNTDCDLHAENPGNINEDTGQTYNHFHWYYAIIEKKGCASHSDFQSEREKVQKLLDIIQRSTIVFDKRQDRNYVEELRQGKVEPK